MNIPKEIIDSDDYKEDPYGRNEYWLAKIKDAVSSGGGGGSSVLVTKTVTANGVYSASDDNADGYSGVTVNVVPNVYCGITAPENPLGNNGDIYIEYTYKEAVP